MSQSLTAGREYIPGLTSNFTDRVYVNYVNSWQATKTISLGGNFFWEKLTDSAATLSEKSDRYGAGFNVNDAFSQQMSVNFDYQYLLKNANPSYLGYYQDLATVGFEYRF
jgi:outer membrane protein assembly factor BamA